MNTQAVSQPDQETTRKIAARLHGEVLRRLADVTQEYAADCMGMHASTVSRMKDGDLERFCHLLAAIGFQLTSGESVVVDQNEQLAIESMALKWMQARHQARLEALRKGEK